MSVVIPVKDDAERLRVCLDALGRQSVAPLEVVVVDNASTDDSAQVARAAGARVVREDRPGIPAAASAGYDAATGEVIARLDADSIPNADWVRAVAVSMARRPWLGAITGGARFSGGPRLLRRAGAALYLGAYQWALLLALGHPALFGSNLAMRRESWEAVRFAVHRSDTEVHDDLDLSFHLGGRFAVAFVPGIAVQISHRPLTDASSMRRRFARGFHTVFVHWPAELPWHRWRTVLARRRATRTERSTPVAESVLDTPRTAD
ncbi:glycosyltransferase family 2 protein [Herbiconiux sp. A18JL235]|uniref:Glycosyltransferase family 2 protein n=1 Tax=Herbiconiux sp. A18JL235 TaxID=3152363 RepID=A0AB39BE00_9MICO